MVLFLLDFHELFLSLRKEKSSRKIKRGGRDIERGRLKGKKEGGGSMGSKKEVVIVLVGAIILPFSSGCLTDENSKTSGANVVLVRTDAKEDFNFNYGFYTKVNFAVENIGNETAFNVRMYLYVENQDKRKEFDNSFHIATEIAPNAVVNKSIIIDSWQNDVLLKAKIKIMWDGGSNEYWTDWTIGG